LLIPELITQNGKQQSGRGEEIRQLRRAQSELNNAFSPPETSVSGGTIPAAPLGGQGRGESGVWGSEFRRFVHATRVDAQQRAAFCFGDGVCGHRQRDRRGADRPQGATHPRRRPHYTMYFRWGNA
jgi:hypothetical protein